MLQAIERYMKQAIVDKVPSVSSSALVSSLVTTYCVGLNMSNSETSGWPVCPCVQHMVKMSYDVVKRWVNEAQEAASSDNIMVQVSAIKGQMSLNSPSAADFRSSWKRTSQNKPIKRVSCLPSTTLWASCITWEKMTAWLSPRCWTSSPNRVWSLHLPTACWSGSPASCWMRQREGEESRWSLFPQCRTLWMNLIGATWSHFIVLINRFFIYLFFLIVTTAPCLTSSRAAWGTRTRWWCTRLPLPLCTCPTAQPGSWRLLCQVSAHLSFFLLIPN